MKYLCRSRHRRPSEVAGAERGLDTERYVAIGNFAAAVNVEVKAQSFDVPLCIVAKEMSRRCVQSPSLVPSSNVSTKLARSDGTAKHKRSESKVSPRLPEICFIGESVMLV